MLATAEYLATRRSTMGRSIPPFAIGSPDRAAAIASGDMVIESVPLNSAAARVTWSAAMAALSKDLPMPPTALCAIDK